MSKIDRGMTTRQQHAQPPSDRQAWSDDDLILAIASGDELALRVLYERHVRWIAVRLRRSLPVSAVEDTLQETFLAAWRGAARFQHTGEVGAWLWGIARRQAALWGRSHGRPDLELDDDISLASLGGSNDDPAEIAIRRVQLRQAFAAAGPAGSPARQLARKVFLEDRSLVEIAADLKIPVGTVKSRVHKLRGVMQAAAGAGTDASTSTGSSTTSGTRTRKEIDG